MSFILPQEKRFRDFNNVNDKAMLQAARSLDWDRLYSLHDVDEQVEHLTDVLNNLIDNFVPWRLLKAEDTTRPVWFSDRLQRLINIRDYFERVSKSERDPQLKIEMEMNFRKMRNKVTTVKINLKAKESQKKLSPLLPPKTLWANLRNQGVTKSKKNQLKTSHLRISVIISPPFLVSHRFINVIFLQTFMMKVLPLKLSLLTLSTQLFLQLKPTQ
jgi:hypothetical protein